MLKIEALTFELNRKKLIQSISLSLKKNGLYGIVGPNGSGKSTFLKCMTGIWEPTDGSVFWQDVNLLEMERAAISRLITLVPQNPQIHFDFTVEDVIAMGRYLHEKANPEVLEWALKTVDLIHLRNRKITQISSGERQRVYIARALVTECPILLLDEPTASLDIRHHLEIWDLLKSLSHQGKLVVASNHDLRITETYCDEVIVLNEGICVAQGIPKDLFSDQLLKTVFGIKAEDFRFDQRVKSTLYTNL